MNTIRIDDDADDQLDCEALDTNQQLLSFDVKSKDIDWSNYVAPLEERAAPVYLRQFFPLISNHCEPVGEHNKREILVCHDMLGNYREDRFFRSSKKYDDYRFYHWAGIDYFCYFSHRYITIPPSGWINAAHRHGVRVLGTFIVEGFRGSRKFHEVLMSLEMMDRVVQALVRLCNHFKFEGWLVNIESKIEATAVENMFYFVETLRSAIENKVKSGCVFWYDSVIESGDLVWQNEINTKNVRFIKSVGAMLINYGWNDNSLEATLNTCQREHIQRHRVFVGIDVFGRGQTAKFQTKRTLARIVRRTMSVGIFAPGWTFETLQQFGYNINKDRGDDAVNAAFLERNDKFWWSLWDQLPTNPFGKLPFYTDTCLGSGKCRYTFGQPDGPPQGGLLDGSRFLNLAQQSLQPSVPLYQLAERHYDDAFNGGSCLRIMQYDSSFRLFVTDFQIRRGSGLVCAYAFKLSQSDGEFDCVLRLSSEDDNSRDSYLFLGDYTNTLTVLKGRCYISPFKSEYAAFLRGPLETKRIPKDSNTANGWHVRYYVVAFDGPVRVRDIGLLYRRTQMAIETAYFGALYMNEFDATTFGDFPADSNFSNINLYGENLLN